MSVIFDETNYQKVRINDPAYQAMIRISDVNNTYDIRQEYVKTGSTRNDFQSQLDLFDNNSGTLSDGKYVDMSKFFVNTKRVISDGKTKVVGENLPYFKFKTNHVLNFYNNTNIKDTYIDKTNVESIYDLIETPFGELAKYRYDETKSLSQNVYNSYPLQRVDRLVVYEMDSLFVYIDGLKIPDNKVFVYANKSSTDVFIPESVIPGNIRDSKSIIDTVINIDYRRSGSEGFYFLDTLSGNTVTIDLTDPKYQYRYYKHKNMNITVDKLLIFVNGFAVKAKSCSVDGTNLTIDFGRQLNGDQVEIYILNNVIYRYNKPVESMINNNGSKVHFYINDDYFTDVVNGPITKNAIQFWYNGKRVDDSYIEQTSRFSFMYNIDLFTYTQVDIPMNMLATPGTNYYIKNKNNEYVFVGELEYFEYDTIYYTRDLQPTFDENLIDFVIEDINKNINDLDYTMYSDDNYLLNMLGVRRCVDKMKGTKSFSVFDEDRYAISFKDVLSDSGTLFDVQTAINKYNEIEDKISKPNDRIKAVIESKPSLLRYLLDQVKHPFKKFVVIGNKDDVSISSVSKLTNPNANAYYKVYLNHMLLNMYDYSVVREGNIDIITIPKEKFEPLVQDENGTLISGRNTVEVFQYDLSFKDRLIFKDNININYEKLIDTDGSTIYRKTFLLKNLPFDTVFDADDLCAIERIERKWFDSTQKEYDYIYPTDDFIGYRMVKQFKVVDLTDTELTIEVKLHDEKATHTNGEFFMMLKQYNVAEQIVFKNTDNSYMEANDLMIPIYSTYTEYEYVDGVKRISSINKFIPYINISEPIITCEGRELIYGKDYTYFNPETNNSLTSSYIILKSQLKEDSIITVQFNSNKTNVLIVGYDDLNINNRYGLIYLSELNYPVSTEYMNIFINGEKVSSYDVDILSDKLIRVHHINRPIRSILITTNSLYKDEEIQEFIDLYKESDFEKLLAEIFWNCDPSKEMDANRPSIDYTYKINPFYKEFVGDLEDKYDNPYYKVYIDEIIANGNSYNEKTIFELIFPSPIEGEEDYELKKEAYDKANKFFAVYRNNHGFVPAVDSVFQAENPYSEDVTVNFITDTLEIMYINWLCYSGKTRSYNFKAENIDPRVLNYFAVFENVIINDTVDIVVDSNRFYDGMKPNPNNEPITTDVINDKIYVNYPGAKKGIRNRFFFNILLSCLENSDDELYMDSETGVDTLVKAMCDHKLSNILYPSEFVLEADKNGILYTGTDYDIVNFDYETEKQMVEKAKLALKNIQTGA